MLPVLCGYVHTCGAHLKEAIKERIDHCFIRNPDQTVQYEVHPRACCDKCPFKLHKRVRACTCQFEDAVPPTPFMLRSVSKQMWCARSLSAVIYLGMVVCVVHLT